jgi:hypothetical protein
MRAQAEAVPTGVGKPHVLAGKRGTRDRGHRRGCPDVRALVTP